MKAQTIHHNPFGDVINQCSACGFRLEDDNGGWIEARVVNGELQVIRSLGVAVEIAHPGAEKYEQSHKA